MLLESFGQFLETLFKLLLTERGQNGNRDTIVKVFRRVFICEVNLENWSIVSNSVEERFNYFEPDFLEKTFQTVSTLLEIRHNRRG